MKPPRETRAQRVRRVCGKPFAGRNTWPRPYWLVAAGLFAMMLAIVVVGFYTISLLRAFMARWYY